MTLKLPKDSSLMLIMQVATNIFTAAIEKVGDQIIFQQNGANCHTTPKIISEIRSYSKNGLS